MKDKYSLTMLVIMIGLLLAGILILIYGQDGFGLIGLIPMILGALMIQGLTWPSDAKTKKVRIITVFGQMTDETVTGPALLLKWPPNILWYVEIDMVKKDHDFNLLKPVLCLDKIYINDEKSKISVSMFPDEEDDDPAIIENPRTGGQKLRDYQNAGGMDGTIKQLDDILTAWIEFMARTHTSQWMEQNGMLIAAELLPRLIGERGATLTTGNPDLDDVKGLGVAFNKFQVLLLPSQKILDARNDVLVQTETREAEKVNTETMNIQIQKRYALYRDGKIENGRVILPPTPIDQIPSLAEIRNMILQENLMHDHKVTQVINKDGINVVNATAAAAAGVNTP